MVPQQPQKNKPLVQLSDSNGCQTKNVKIKYDILIQMNCKHTKFTQIFIKSFSEDLYYFTDFSEISTIQ